MLKASPTADNRGCRLPQEEGSGGSQPRARHGAARQPLWGLPPREHSEGATLRQRMMLTHEFRAPVALRGRWRPVPPTAEVKVRGRGGGIPVAQSAETS